MSNSVSNGSAWRAMQSMTICDLNKIAGRLGYGFEEEMARSMLRIRLHGEIQAKRAFQSQIEEPQATPSDQHGSEVA